METGVNIICKKTFGQFLLTEQPYCVLNGVETRQLEWGKEIFIPLLPDSPYQITIQFPYMKKACGVATINLNFKTGEIQTYVYRTPFIVYSPGTIKRVS